MSDHAALARLAAEVGLPAAEVEELLAGDRFADAVRDDERTGASLGISGVPFFVVDRGFGASGAQPPELLGQLLGARLGRAPAGRDGVGGEACGPDGC